MLVITIKKRREFLAISKQGKRFYGQHFLVQRLSNPNFSDIFRTGYVATRKTGNAVKRNRAKRRLRALVYTYRTDFPKGWDYVFVVRSSFWSADFDLLKKDFEGILEKIKATPSEYDHSGP